MHLIDLLLKNVKLSTENQTQEDSNGNHGDNTNNVEAHTPEHDSAAVDPNNVEAHTSGLLLTWSANSYKQRTCLLVLQLRKCRGDFLLQ